MRVCLFTDTLGDVNGVSRFIRAVAGEAEASGRELLVASSTRFPIPDRPNLRNFWPRLAVRMPRYENLELTRPPARAMLEWATGVRPDAVHVSTPGPVGMAGRRIARRLGVPLVGTYHTDFPAYIDHLFDDRVLTWATGAYMRWFYRPFARVLTRSRGYAASVERLGVAAGRVVPLEPGIDVGVFHPRHREAAVWDRLGVGPGVRVLYVGRVSVEKNLPLLSRAWKMLRPAGAVSATLVVVGDGPYRASMERELVGRGAHFPGFRHGPELSAIYASADLFVFPSATDTLGQAVMEAQASGLPALVSDVGGPREIVQHGRTGLVLPALEPAAWAGAIARLIADGGERGAMGAAAHARAGVMSIRTSFEQFWSEHAAALA